MSREGDQLPIGKVSFPRVSGDEPKTQDLIDAQKTFSPRERG